MSAFFRRLSLILSLLVTSYAAILIYPNWAFAHSYRYETVTVYADRPIDKTIEDRLDTALANLAHSELYEPDIRFSIFISHNRYRLALFTRNPKVGGMVNGVISQNIFLRESDIAADRIIPPGSYLMDAENRTLTYFLTHEMTHALQARHQRFMRLTHPSYIMEGYADYIAKRATFNYETALAAFRSNHDFYAKSSPLYNRQHLAIAALMEKEGLSFKDILAVKPDLESVLEKIDD